MRKIVNLFFILALLSLPLGACSTKKAENHSQQPQLGDMREETESTSVLPPFLDNKSDDMKLIYRAVSQHQHLLEQIPCYCGCGDSVEHKDNYDCFIYKNNEDGSLVWDDHATRCQACLDIAAESIVMYSEGKSIKDIRDHIDNQYKEGYAEPTPTPEV